MNENYGYVNIIHANIYCNNPTKFTQITSFSGKSDGNDPNQSLIDISKNLEMLTREFDSDSSMSRQGNQNGYCQLFFSPTSQIST